MLLPEEIWEQSRQIVSVSAPAGYGKSTLLSQWRSHFENDGARVVWLTASGDDREGSKLLLDFAQSLEHAHSQSPESLIDRYGSQGWEAVIKALYAELTALSPRAALFVDDVHELLDGPAESMLRLLLRYQPARVVLVLCGRAPVHLAVSKALLEGRLIRYADTQLALNKAEISSLLEQHGIRPREELISVLQDRTQGWPAAVRLVALTMQGDTRSQDQFVSGLGLGPQSLTDYLNDNLVAQQSPRMNQFLQRVSLLRQFTVRSARAVTGFDDTAEILDEIHRSALPIRCTSDSETVYVLHPLMRDFLLARLMRLSAKEIERYRTRALRWLLKAEQIDKAIEVCLDSNDLAGAAALISEHAAAMVQRYGRHVTYLYWINKLPKEELAQFPEIRLKQAWSLNFLQRYEEAESIRNELELEIQESAGTVDAQWQERLEQAIELQRCAEAALRDRAVTSIARSSNWLRRWPQGGEFERSVANSCLAFSQKTLGRFELAERHGRQGQTLARQCQDHYVLAWATMLTASVLIKQGQCRQALYECDHGLAELQPHLDKRAPATMMLHAMRAGLLYEFNQLDEVRDALEEGLTALVEQSSADPMIIGFVTLARLQAIGGNVHAGIETLHEGEVLGRGRQLPRLAITLAAERIVLLLRSGEFRQARQQWESLHEDPALGGAGSFAKALEDKAGRIQARIGIAEGKYQEALELLARPLEHARATGQRRKLVELLLLRAIALRQSKAPVAETFETLGDAVGIAMQGGYVRTLVDEGEPLRRLLAEYTSGGVAAPPSQACQVYLREIDIAMHRASPEAGNEDDEFGQKVVEPLTERELQIVVRLKAGPSNRQLSDALLITPGTLKWHLSNIYAKLGVSNRLAAISRAQALGLVD